MRKLINILLGVCLISLVLFSCIPYTIIDPVLLPYDKQFLDIVKIYCKPGQYLSPLQKTIYFEDIKDRSRIAYCKSNGYTTFNIVYSTYHWNIQSEDEKFATMRHEEFHCYFGINHSPNPNHFMYAFENNLSRQVIEEQTIELLKALCK